MPPDNASEDGVIKEVKSFLLEFGKVIGHTTDAGDAKYPYPITPMEFLDYAETNLNQSGPQALGDSLSNTKRALDSELDYFLMAYGLGETSEALQWGTAKKIQVIGDVAGVPPRILQLINRARNDMEHRFMPPDRVTAENALDVVTMFVGAIDLFLFPVHEGNEYYYRRGGDRQVRIAVESEGGRMWVGIRRSKDTDEWQETSLVESLKNLQDYLFLLCFVLHSHRLYAKDPRKFFVRLKPVERMLLFEGKPSSDLSR